MYTFKLMQIVMGSGVLAIQNVFNIIPSRNILPEMVRLVRLVTKKSKCARPASTNVRV